MAVAALAVVLLAGCTAPGGPAPSPVASVVVSESPSVTPSPSELSAEEKLLAQIPDAAKGDDLLAAVEMAKFFLVLHPGLYQGEDPALFEFLSLPECEFCTSSVAAAERELSEGRVQSGGDFIFADKLPESVIDMDSGSALIGIWVTEEAYEVSDSAGATVAERGAKLLKFSLELEFAEGLWRVAGVGFEDA